MKKSMKIMTAALVLLSGLLLAGCAAAETVKEIVDATHNQWYKYKSDKEIDIPVLAGSVADEDNTAESSQKLKNAEIYFYYDSNDGLLAAIQSKTEQEVEMLHGLYKQNMVIPMGATKQFTKEQFGTAKWTSLTLAIKLEKCDAPEIVSNPDGCILLGSKDNEPKIQWKKFLANYLLGNYLED